MLPNFQDIYYFLEVLKAGNISRAAERIGMTQPSLSQAIKRLEGIAGAPLLIRNKNGIQVTKAGVTIQKRGQSLIQDWRQINSEIKNQHTTVSGQYTIGCHPSVALYSLPKVLKSLLSKYPKLEINLKHDLSRLITDSVINYQTDFAIVINPVKHPDLVIKELCKDIVQLWGSIAKSKLQEIDSSKKVLICDLKLIQTQKIIRDLKNKNIIFDRVIDSSSLELIASLVAEGCGIGILPSSVAAHFEKRRLKTIDKNLPIFNDRVCLIYRKDFQVTSASKVIIEEISQLANLDNKSRISYG